MELHCPYCGHELIDLGDGEWWCHVCSIIDTEEGWTIVGASGYGIDDWSSDEDYPRTDRFDLVE